MEVATSSGSEIRINTEISLGSINWEGVAEFMVKRLHLPADQVSKQIKDFVQLFIVPLEPFWFSHHELSSEYNLLIAAICEVHGADSVTLSKELKLELGPLALSHNQRIRFVPTLKNISKVPGTTSLVPRIELQILGRKVEITNQSQVIIWRAIALATAIALSVPFLGCFLYAFAVFMVFLEAPSDFTIVAFDHASLGLALLCFLVGFAGLFGRAIVNSKAKIKELVKKQ